MNSIALKEQLRTLVADTTNWYNKSKENPDLNENDVHTEFDKRMADADRIKKEIATLERGERLEAANAELAQSAGRKTSPVAAPATRSMATVTRSERNKAFKSWLGYGIGLNGLSYDGAAMQRCAELGFDLHNQTTRMNMRSVNTLTGAAGGYTTFSTTYPDLETELKYYSPIIGEVDTQVTGDGNPFVMPRGSDVSRTFSPMTQASSTGYVQADPTFDKITLGAYFYRGVVPVSFEMLADAVFDVEAWINSQLAEGAARTIENNLVAGSGSSAPTGLIAACVAADGGTPAYTLTSSGKTLTSLAQIDSLVKTVDKAYRDAGTLIFHDSTFWDLRAIVDDDHRPVWVSNFDTAGVDASPNVIRGVKYLISNSMDASNSFAKNIVLFANLKRHVLRMADSVQLTKLVELYRAQGLVGIECMFRFDCNYRGHAASIARIKTAAS